MQIIFIKNFRNILHLTTRKIRVTRIQRLYYLEKIMKQNITLSIEKETIKKGKIIAAHNDTSLSKMLSNTLEKIVDKEDQYEASKKRAMQYLRKGFHLGGKITWKREDLYER